VIKIIITAVIAAAVVVTFSLYKSSLCFTSASDYATVDWRWCTQSICRQIWINPIYYETHVAAIFAKNQLMKLNPCRF